MYDVIIIGAGITGTAIARELSKYNLRILLVDKSYDVSNGSTKANSAIIHAGYDCKPATLMAKLNVEGNLMYEKLCKELSVPFKRVGSLVLAFTLEDLTTLEELFQRGVANGISDMKLLSVKESIDIEPNVNKDIKGALYAPSAGIVSPYEMAIAFAENAYQNGVDIKLNTEILDIEKNNDDFLVFSNKGEFTAKTVVNAAGIYADRVNDMIADKDRFRINPRKGQYILLNKTAGNLAKHVVFQCPTEKGKGILVSPTVYGNTLIGPDAQDVGDRTDVSTSEERLNMIMDVACKSFSEIPFKKTIRKFAGLRAESDRGDFIVSESKDAKGFFNAAGIKSPGLSSAPALAKYLSEMILGRFSDVTRKENFIYDRKHPLLQFMSSEEKAKKKKNDSLYNKIVCRCEKITEGEIMDAVSRFPYPSTKDGVKRRARAGMGPCQGNFCGPKVEKLLKDIKKHN